MRTNRNKGLLAYLSLLAAITNTEWHAALADTLSPTYVKSTSIVGHGMIEAIDLKKHQLTIKHDAIKTLDWPAMTMAFIGAENLDMNQLKVGEVINFQLEKNKANQMTITHIEKSQ